MVKLKFLLSFWFFLFHSCFFIKNVAAQDGSVNSTALFHVGVVLDLSSNIGKIAQSCISMAISEFYDINANHTTRLELHPMDSKNDVVTATSSALYLMKDVAVQAIIGPQQSAQASFVIDLGEKAQVPIVSFSATSPSLSPLKSPYFIRTAINESSQVKAIASIIQNFEWKEVVLIFEDTDYGNGAVPYFIDAFREIDVHVPYRSIIPLNASDEQISKELNALKTMQTRVFIVHMSSSVGSQLFIKAKDTGMMSQGYAWIVTDGLSSLLARMDSKATDSMEGVLGVRPYVPKSKELEEFKVRWKRMFYPSSKSYREISEPGLHGSWAYDTVWALAMAVEGLGTLDPQFLSANNTDNLTDISSLGYSTIGPRLLQNILSTSFKGLSGDFRLVNGELESSGFEIFNVISEVERVVGYWNPTGGISRQLNKKNRPKNSSSMSNMKAIIWPGESTTKPMGWDISTKGKDSLRVLVPYKSGFEQFVHIDRDPITNKTINVTGFCPEVFHKITSRLPFGLSYEFIGYPLNGSVLDDYNALVSEVNHENYDAAVGDITILANRSRDVDFTMPYTESGVVMVVPVKDNLEKEFWMFLKPLSLGLWLVTISGFIYIGLAVWILEHPSNTELGITRRERLQASLWYSFLTLVFSQRERIENNLTKAVLITWIFFILILTQSYTASLSSTLTVRQFKPTITDVLDIKKHGYYVGFQSGSFVKGFLQSQFNLTESKLRDYSTPEDYHYALSNGTDNGGVAAIFDELPYIQVFLSKHCNQYTTVGPTYSSEGFGFVFSKGSHLIPYLSLAILNITDDGTLDKIKKEWLEDTKNCSDGSSSSQLTMRSFGGLFLIIGVVSGLSLLIHLLLLMSGRNINISLRLTWQITRDRISYIKNALKGTYHGIQVVRTENQPTADDDTEGIVEGETIELQHRSAEIREEHNIEPQHVVGILSNQCSRRSMQSSRPFQRAMSSHC